MDPSNTSSDEPPAKKQRRRVALEPEAYRDQLKTCPKCGASGGEDIKFKYLNNKKESQARYQCTKCKHKFMLRYQRRSHPNGYPKAHQRQQTIPTPGIAINHGQPITSLAHDEKFSIEQGDQLQHVSNLEQFPKAQQWNDLCAHDEVLNLAQGDQLQHVSNLEQFPKAQQWNDLHARDEVLNLAQGDQQSLNNIVYESGEDMQSSSTGSMFMGSLAHGGALYDQGDQQSVHNIANEGPLQGQLREIMSSLGSPTLVETPYLQIDEQDLRNIVANDRFDEEEISGFEVGDLFAHGEFLESYLNA